MEAVFECVPNFSEGRDAVKIEQIAKAIRNIPGISLLNIDPGYGANRTVFTFTGPGDAIVEAAYESIKTASVVIDMRVHRGAHPRMGATDVCPIIPLANATMEEAVELSVRLAERVGNDLAIPVYLYENSASVPERKNLATVRKGGYEGLKERVLNPSWKPDFGPASFNERSGATAIGARPFLLAFNVNLNSKNPSRASAIARKIRQSGYLDKSGKRIEGLIPGVKAIGWFIPEFNRVQVSMNIVDIARAPLHLVFEEVIKLAQKDGLRVTGSEIVGMVPEKVLINAGKYYLEKQNEPVDIFDKELIDIAILSLELNDVVPFDPEEKILEKKIRKVQGK